MAHYSVGPRDRIFVKGYGFLSFTINKGKIMVRMYVKIQAVNTVGKFLIMQKMHLKLFQKEQFKKQQKQLAI